MAEPADHARVLATFRNLFEGKVYKHRNSSLGDQVACQLYEDLTTLARSKKLVGRVQLRECVVNTRNVPIGKTLRRGDGTFGELVPAGVAETASGFLVARGPVANIQIGTETKILAKAMQKQIDRVTTSLSHQAGSFRSAGGNPITVALVGVNHAERYTSYERDREYPTDGSRVKHPSQEAEKAIETVRRKVSPAFDELLILPFSATNEPPYPFEWVDFYRTSLEYSALLVRVAREYDKRF